jgi:dUTPase
MNKIENIIIEMKDDSIEKPKRSTNESAGHDIFSPIQIEIKPKSIVTIDIPFYFLSVGKTIDFTTHIYLRSSFGIKKKVRLLEGNKRVEFLIINPFKKDNQITLFNDSDETIIINKNEHFCQYILSNIDASPINDLLVESVSNVEKEKQKNITKSRIEKKELITKYVLDEDIILAINEQKILATGLKSKIPYGTWLGIHINENFKNSLYLGNGVAVIDADYYNNIGNDGHLFFAIVNRTNNELTLKKDSHIIDFIVEEYLVLADEKSINNIRTSGIGST